MCFIDHFSVLDEPRKDINIRYGFLDIVFLTVCAVVSGAEGWKDIKQFGDEKIEWLRQYRPYQHGIPVDDTNSPAHQGYRVGEDEPGIY
ncbi:transposase family protein [Enterobacter bugandensis]|uniref:transposase family protein n=1 Tax=Enterobacter bugandensis TaxID=881260 RepID=UPI00359C2C4E